MTLTDAGSDEPLCPSISFLKHYYNFSITFNVILRSISGTGKIDSVIIFNILGYPTKNSSGDEIANVNFLYDDIVHILQNTIDSCINSATDRRGYVLDRMFTKFSEIAQYNGHYVVQGYSRSPIFVPIESSYTTSY